MDLFLKAKHWQLFLTTFGVTLTLNLLSAWSFLHGTGMPGFLPLLTLIPVLVNLCWLWSIGISLRRLLPDSLKINPSKFRLFFAILTGEIILAYFCSGVLWGVTAEQALRDFHKFTAKYYFLSVPAFLVGIFSLIYCIWFAARTIKTAELCRPTRYSDFSGTFLAFFFYPMGIWNLQSRINGLIREK